MNHELIDAQAGFWKGRGTRDQIANIHWIIQKAREFQKNIYFCFIDYAKAFVWITTNCGKFLEMGITDHLTCLLRNLYAGQEATVRTGHGTTDWFQTGKGERQGCTLSPCLFNLYAEYFRRRQWQPTLVLLPGKSHGRRSLVGYSPWGHKESDTTEGLHFHVSLSLFTFMHWRRKWQPTPVFLPGKSQGREPGELPSMESHRVRHDWATSLSPFTFMHWKRKWQPTPVFLPGESQERGSLVGCRLWGHTESDTTEAT